MLFESYNISNTPVYVGQIAINNEGLALVTWIHSDGILYPTSYAIQHYQVYATTYMSGSGWSTPINFDVTDANDRYSFVPSNVAMNESGDAVVVYMKQYRHFGAVDWPNSIWAAYYSPASGWTKSMLYQTPIDYYGPVEVDVDTPRVGITSNGNSVVSLAAGFREQQ